MLEGEVRFVESKIIALLNVLLEAKDKLMEDCDEGVDDEKSMTKNSPLKSTAWNTDPVAYGVGEDPLEARNRANSYRVDVAQSTL